MKQGHFGKYTPFVHLNADRSITSRLWNTVRRTGEGLRFQRGNPDSEWTLLEHCGQRWRWLWGAFVSTVALDVFPEFVQL
jgi:hypothetical protein